MIHPTRPIHFIVIHTCGAYDPKRKKVVHQGVDEVRAYHLRPAREGGKGWKDIGYHRYIEFDGTIRQGRPDVAPGAHCEGFNANTLAICVSGHGDYEPFNAQQMGSLIEQCVRWCKRHELDAGHVIGHRECDDHGAPKVWKTCPGNLVDLDLIRALVARELRDGEPPTGIGQGMPEV